MRDARLLAVCLILISMAGCASAAPAGEPNLPPEPNALTQPATRELSELDSMLARLNGNVAKLKSCRLELTWTFFQPLLETSTTRKGMLYYKKVSDRSNLRINFNSFQQDKEKPQPLREEIIFDGVWLTRIDYQLKEIKRDQLAPDDKPLDAFQLLTGRMPLVGFGSIDDLKKQFEIEMKASGESGDGIVVLVLTPRADSEYVKDYKRVEIYTEATEALPGRIKAITPDDDVSEIVLVKSGSQDVADTVFAFEKPRDFAVISKPLKNDEK
jgi:hypothetical protein